MRWAPPRSRRGIGEARITHHLLAREEEIADGGGEVVEHARAEDGQLLADGAQEPEVVVHGDERERVQQAVRVRALVRAEHLAQRVPLRRRHVDVRARARRGRLDVEEVEEGVRRVRVVPAEGLQAELAVHEDDGVARLEEVFGGRRAAGA